MTGNGSDRARTIFIEAQALHKGGELARAKAMYEGILAWEPRHFDSLHMLGVLALQSGQPHIAHDLISRALFIRSDLAPPHVNLALALQALGRLDEALASFDRALRLNPDHFTVHHDRATLLLSLGRPTEAIASFDEAIALRPGLAQPHYGRGNAWLKLGRLDEAIASYDRAIAIGPGFAEVHNNRGLILFSLNRMDEALACYDRALALKSDYAEAWNNRGNALWHVTRHKEALADYDRAIACKPDYAKAHGNRGNALLALGQPGEAVVSFKQVLAFNRGREFLTGMLLLAKMKACDWDGLEGDIAAFRRAIEAGETAAAPFLALVMIDDPELQKQAALNFARSVAQSSAPARFGKRMAGERIRLGYYSADFHNHATSYLIAELFERHDRDRFELFAFSFGPDRKDPMRRRITAACEHFIDVAALSDGEVAARSRDLGMDIAVDLKGYTENARPGIFAARCAPVQVNYLGYPGTLGARHIDYLIADKIVAPPAEQGNYTEKLVYLPDSYQANDGARAISGRRLTRAAAGLPETGFVFCCFNTMLKISPAMLDGWARILGAVEGSVLWLYEDNAVAAANLRREAAARGVDPGRLIFAPHMPLDEHLARHRLADLFLDTWPCNAHTTASDALWAGLPVLTLSGRSFASRVAASLLRAIELPELIAANERDYEARAIELATTPAKLAKLGSKLERNRPASPLFDARRFARNIEKAYVAMYRRCQAGLAPDVIDLEAAQASRASSS